MANKKETISESKVIASQQKAWTEHNLLYLINKGSTWRAFNESAYVLSALLHFKLTRRIKKRGSTSIDSVTFMAANLGKVLAEICSSGGEILEKEERRIIYRWNKDVPLPESFSVVRGKEISKNFRFDERTNSELKKITSSGGFGGKSKATESEVIRFAINHFYDNKPINLKDAEPLVWTISQNRAKLDAVLETLSWLIRELNAIGVNINQIAHQINCLMMRAADEGINTQECISLMNRFYDRVISHISELAALRMKIEGEIAPARDATLAALEGENEIMNRILL